MDRRILMGSRKTSVGFLRTAVAISVLALAGMIGGCAGRAGASPESASGEMVHIRHGETISIDAGALEVTFESVASDSRCPKGEACVWEGDGIVVLAVRAPAKAPARLELHTSTRGPSAAGYAGWAIRLEALEPYPVTGRTIADAKYVATLSVVRGGETESATQ